MNNCGSGTCKGQRVRERVDIRPITCRGDGERVAQGENTEMRGENMN